LVYDDFRWLKIEILGIFKKASNQLGIYYFHKQMITFTLINTAQIVSHIFIYPTFCHCMFKEKREEKILQCKSIAAHSKKYIKNK
jgi:hypothetical protein